MELKCTKCGERARRKGGYYCLGCHAAQMRETRPTYREMKEVARRKSNARSYARTYMVRGRLVRQVCETCGEAETEMHHEDYSRPLAVRWMCRCCHMGEHERVKGQSL